MKKLVLLFIAMSMLFVACPTSPSISNVAPSWARGTYQYEEDGTENKIVLVIYDSKAVLLIGDEDPNTEGTTHEFGKEINEEDEGTDTARTIKTTVVTNSNSVFEFHATETVTEADQNPTTITAKFKITTDKCVMTVVDDEGVEESRDLIKKNS